MVEYTNVLLAVVGLLSFLVLVLLLIIAVALWKGLTLPVFSRKPVYRVERRNTEAGDVDEVLLYRNDECLMHLEYMDEDLIWIGLYEEGRGSCLSHVNISSETSITVHEDPQK